MKKIILATAIALSASTSAYAQGIPVYDATAVLKMIEQATMMANQLVELKNQVQALTDFKGFAEELTGIGDEINNAISQLKDGLTDATKIGNLKELYNKHLDEQLAKVEELSKRIQKAPDTKAMSEIQAEIGLRQQAAEIIKEQKEIAENDIAAENALISRGLEYELKGDFYSFSKAELEIMDKISNQQDDSSSSFDNVLMN